MVSRLPIGVSACVLVLVIVAPCFCAANLGLPGDNPAVHYRLAWTDSLKWSNVISIEDFAGQSIEQRLEKAQQAVAEEGGGVVYFPAGAYTFAESIRIRSGIIIRAARPQGTSDARQEGYEPPTRFEFPKYEPTFEGQGRPIETAYKGIYLEDPERASDCGIVNVSINRGHIDFQEGPDHRCGRNRLVYGCVLRNAAVADPRVPDTKRGQHAWQRFTHRHHAAVTVKSSENVLIANNRLPKSGDDNFTMKGYLLRGKPFDVVFDYDNRPGLYINDYGLGGKIKNEADAACENNTGYESIE